MFPFGHNPYGYAIYDPYEQALLQQELQRRRQAEEYQRRRQLEELNRRRAEQLEYARRQAEVQRLREAEARRRHQMEVEARRRKLSEPRTPRPRIRMPQPHEEEAPRIGRPQSMFDGGMQDLFDALYGSRGHPYAPMHSSNTRRAKSSDPRARDPVETNEQASTKDSAVSDEEDEQLPTASSQPAPEASTDAEPQPDQAGITKAQSAISDILKSFSDLKSGFSLPQKLDWLSTPGDATVTVPKLAYTPNNAPVHQYEHLLTGLLTKLDAIDSCGQDSIRVSRKDAVKQIEKELEEVDVKKLQDWQRQSEEATAATAVPVELALPPLPTEPTEPVAPDAPEIPAPLTLPSEPEPVVPVQPPESIAPATSPAPHSEPPEDSSKEVPASQSQSGASAGDDGQAVPADISSSTPDPPSGIAPTQSSGLQPISSNIESSQNATPTPALSQLTLETAPQAEVGKPSEHEAIEDGYVDLGREVDASDNGVSPTNANPDESWEVEF